LDIRAYKGFKAFPVQQRILEQPAHKDPRDLKAWMELPRIRERLDLPGLQVYLVPLDLVGFKAPQVIPVLRVFKGFKVLPGLKAQLVSPAIRVRRDFRASLV
jgi:hypothetical protein